MPLGLYISLPFCRSKCTFCNFASGVFSGELMSGYVERVSQEIAGAETLVASLGAHLERTVDSIYLGGGTPTTLAPKQLRQLFQAVRDRFDVRPDAEVTVECAPGTIHPRILDALLESGTNRISLGTQSLLNQEIRAVGRLHSAEQALVDVATLRKSGLENINIDLIAGLPHQTGDSWRVSLGRAAELAAPHASVYMLEVDQDSRLGRELIAGGERYHARHVPDSDLVADLYLEAIEFFAAIGLRQYEISNFARPGLESRHNLKYWKRQPYLGFGLDAHSMIPARSEAESFESVRFSNPDDLTEYLRGSSPPRVNPVDREQAIEESLFLGLRLNRGIDASLRARATSAFGPEIEDLLSLGLLEGGDQYLRLSARGRLLSNEVFERFIAGRTAPEGGAIQRSI